MKTILFCGGGSAGHVIPNVALIDDLKDEYKICYAGTNAIEMQICANNNIPFFEFDGVKLVRGKIWRNLLIPFKLLKSVKACKKIIKELNPNLIFCKGGYASLPVAMAGKRLGVPVITHESDVKMGLANKIISKFSKKVLCTFEGTANSIKNGIFVGSPMRKSLFNRDKIKAKSSFGFDMRPTIIVFGGGSGSKIINDALRNIIVDICKKYNVLHVCGKNDVTHNSVYGYKQVEFVDDMGKAYACADFAVARCGSNSANELVALKIPTLFIPLENGASRGDQVDNANYFYKKGLCHVLREKDLTSVTLFDNLDKLICDEELKRRLNNSKIERGNKKIVMQIKNYL